MVSTGKACEEMRCWRLGDGRGQPRGNGEVKMPEQRKHVGGGRQSPYGTESLFCIGAR